MFFTFTAPQYDYEKEVRKNPTQKKLDDLKKKNINRASPLRDYVESILKRLGETIDTSKMNAALVFLSYLVEVPARVQYSTTAMHINGS